MPTTLINDIALEISAPQEAILTSTSDVNLFMAGIGSGKSHSIGIDTAETIINDPEVIQFIGANTYSQLSKSTLFRVFEVWKELYGFRREVDYVLDRRPPKSYQLLHEPLKDWDNTICFKNGAWFFTASLDNYKVIDGTQFGKAYLDETKDTKEEAVKEVITMRLRQPAYWIDGHNTIYKKKHYDYFTRKGIWQYVEVADKRILVDARTQQPIRSWNPLNIYTSPAKVSWINEWFGLIEDYENIIARIYSKTDFYQKQTKSKCVVISSSYHNEKNLPVGFIDNKVDELKITNPNLIDMLIYANPIAKTGGEYAHQFVRTKHVKKVRFLDHEALPVHLTLDFNTNPYMTGLCAQLLVDPTDNRKKLRIFREYCLASPRNTTEDICSALASEFGSRMHGLFYYGDASGRNRQTVTKEYTDNYDTVSKKLRRYLNNKSDRVLHVNPALLKSRDFLNHMLAGTYGIDLEIDESCAHLIADLEYGKEDNNGGILKEETTDKNTGRKYQKYGHCSDAIRYLLVSLFNKLYEKS